MQARAEALAEAVAIAVGETEALVAGSNCQPGSGANAVAAAEGTAKSIAEAFAFAVAEASDQNTEAIAQADATAIEVSALAQLFLYQAILRPVTHLLIDVVNDGSSAAVAPYQGFWPCMSDVSSCQTFPLPRFVRTNPQFDGLPYLGHDYSRRIV